MIALSHQALIKDQSMAFICSIERNKDINGDDRELSHLGAASALLDMPHTSRWRFRLVWPLLESNNECPLTIFVIFCLESLPVFGTALSSPLTPRSSGRMAEFLAAGTALGVASSLISFVDAAWRVLKRLKEYNDRAGDGPAIVKSISAQLPILIDKMEELKLETEMGHEPINPQTSLAVAITSCDELIQHLDVLTRKLLPDEMESRPKRLKKALSSVYYEKELSKTWEEIENYKTLLILHFTRVKGAVQEHGTLQSNRPVFTVPFEKDLKFIGRVDAIANIEQALKRQSRVAIAGIGGVG